jgi:hypothetical protein
MTVTIYRQRGNVHFIGTKATLTYFKTPFHISKHVSDEEFSISEEYKVRVTDCLYYLIFIRVMYCLSKRNIYIYMYIQPGISQNCFSASASLYKTQMNKIR